jgi:ankyrin repeat protein
VLLVGCGESQPPEPPDISIVDAAYKGNIEAVKQAIADGADVNAKPGGITPLRWAAWRGRKEIAELLIAKGADVNAKDLEGSTPLFYADLNGDKETIKLLIAKGADVNAKEIGGDTPLDDVLLDKEIADLLRKHGGKTAEELKAEGK